jgi:hypothetical protein
MLKRYTLREGFTDGDMVHVENGDWIKYKDVVSLLQICIWTKEDDSWETSCDNLFVIEGTLKDNDIKFCPHCGRLIYTEDDDARGLITHPRK